MASGAVHLDPRPPRLGASAHQLRQRGAHPQSPPGKRSSPHPPAAAPAAAASLRPSSPAGSSPPAGGGCSLQINPIQVCCTSTLIRERCSTPSNTSARGLGTSACCCAAAAVCRWCQLSLLPVQCLLPVPGVTRLTHQLLLGGRQLLRRLLGAPQRHVGDEGICTHKHRRRHKRPCRQLRLGRFVRKGSAAVLREGLWKSSKLQVHSRQPCWLPAACWLSAAVALPLIAAGKKCGPCVLFTPCYCALRG